jgi:regulatory protein
MKRLNTTKDIEKYALKILSRKESSYMLLKIKILEKTDEPHLIDNILDKFVSNGWLSDERFAECYVRNTRDNKGYGPNKIKSKLIDKGISSELICKYLLEDHPIWARNAFKLRNKKYGNVPTDDKEINKQIHFLQSRGFNLSQIEVSLKSQLPEEYDES